MTRNNIEVGIAMGSDSDLPIMEEASKCLDELKSGDTLLTAELSRLSRTFLGMVNELSKLKGVEFSSTTLIFKSLAPTVFPFEIL